MSVMKKIQFQNAMHQQKDRVFNYSVYFLKNRQDAEDVTQEVFIKLWDHWENIDRNKMSSWIMQVAHNRCIDRYRKRKKTIVNHVNFEDAPVQSELTDDNPGHDPDLTLENNELHETLLHALDQLSETTKSIFLLHYFQNYRLEDISTILDININTVKVQMHRGKKTMKSILKKSYPEIVEVM